VVGLKEKEVQEGAKVKGKTFPGKHFKKHKRRKKIWC